MNENGLYPTLYNGYYVTKDGDIYSTKKKGKWLKYKIDKYGYPCVRLYINGKGVYKTVHRIVAETFIPNPENKKTVNHKNGIKTDNHIDNLEWNTYAENVQHSFRVLGQRGPKMKMIEKYKDGQLIETYMGTHDAERKGVSRTYLKCIEKDTFNGYFAYLERNDNRINIYWNGKLMSEYSIDEAMEILQLSQRAWLLSRCRNHKALEYFTKEYTLKFIYASKV